MTTAMSRSAEEVGWDSYYRVVNGVMEMLHPNRPKPRIQFQQHGATWLQYTPEAFIQDLGLLLRRPRCITALQVMQNTQAKDDALAALDGTDFGTNVRL